MSFQRMDADTAETLAGWSGCYAEPLSWCGRLPTPRVPGRLGRCWRWALTWPPTRHEPATGCHCCRRTCAGRRRTGGSPTLRRAAAAAHRHPGAGAAVHGLRARVADLVWEANTGVDA